MISQMFVTLQNTSNVERRKNAFLPNSDAMENTIAVKATIRTRIFAGVSHKFAWHE